VSAPRVVRSRGAGEEHDVITVEGDGGVCARPCAECPWRRENAGSFPAEAFRISAPTAYDMADRVFGCHMSGAQAPRSCAGAMLSTGAEHNLQVRLRIVSGRFSWADVHDGGADLFRSYREMAEANGVDPDDPALRSTR
jgi:hypothetical protein